MERYNKGYMGQFSGKLGPASGNSWRGVSYLRSNPGKSKKKNVSEKIEIQSAKFRLAANFIKTMGSVLAITFPDYKTNMTSRNNAVANVLNQAITGDYPDLRIEYSKVFMASGSLSVTIDPAAHSTEPGTITFSWSDSTNYGNAKPNDKPILIAYPESLNLRGFSPTHPVGY